MSEYSEFSEADNLFKQLNVELAEDVEDTYFSDPKDFRSFIEVLKVLGSKADQIDKRMGEDLVEALKHQNPAYSTLLKQQKFVDETIEKVVTFQHGGLNNSVDTMTAVVKEYTKGQEEISFLRRSLVDTKNVLTAKKSGQMAMKDLWLKKKELDETLRIVSDLEWLKDTPLRVHRLIQQRKYLNAVGRLNKGLERMFSEDLADVMGVSNIREQLMELKGRILDEIVTALRNDIVGVNSSLVVRDIGDEDLESQFRDGESEAATEVPHAAFDTKSIFTVGSNEGQGSALLPLGPSIAPFHDQKALGLLAVDEALELGLTDVVSSGSVYIRLLVRAVGSLHCENDVERLLLDSASDEFLHVIQRHRLSAFSKLKRSVGKYQNGGDDSNVLDLLIIEEFAAYITALLEAALTLLKKLLYVFRLLSFSKYLSSVEPNSNIQLWKYTIQESNRRALLSLWSDVEAILIHEMKIHFVEKDVESISDLKTITTQSLLGSKSASSSLIPSNSYEGEDSGADDSGPIFPPSVRLSAAVYQIVQQFVDAVNDVFHEEEFMNVKPVTSEASVIPSKPATIMSAILSQQPEKIDSHLLNAIQDVLEKEFIPVVQGSTNQAMRDIQTNSRQYFSPPAPRSVVNADNDGKSYQSSGRSIVESPRPCLAALICLREATPLFNYWLQLPQHSDMVATILDRLVRGFVSSAREEVESLTWKFLSGQEKFKGVFMTALRSGRDSWFESYRRHVYNGKMTAGEIIVHYGHVRGSSQLSAMLSSITSSNSKSLAYTPPVSSAAEMAPVWEVSSAKYIVTIDKIAQDYSIIGSLASLGYSCDWLIFHLSKSCASAIRKLCLSFEDTEPSNHAGRGLSRHFKDELLVEMQKTMIREFIAYINELSKLSEDCWATLQLETQISCFYYLHQVAYIKLFNQQSLLKSSSISNLQGSNRAGKEEEASGAANQVEANIVLLLSKHLLQLQDSIISASTHRGATVVEAPLAQLIPRILQKCITSLLSNQTSNGLVSTHDDAIIAIQQSVFQEGRSRLLRLVVITQQSLSMVYETAKLDANTFKILQETASDCFEHVRKFVSLMDLTMNDLKIFITAAVETQRQQRLAATAQSVLFHYDAEDFKAMWKYIQHKSAVLSTSSQAQQLDNFDEFWKSLKGVEDPTRMVKSSSQSSLIRASKSTDSIQQIAHPQLFPPPKYAPPQTQTMDFEPTQPSAPSKATPAPAAAPSASAHRSIPLNPFAGWKK